MRFISFLVACIPLVVPRVSWAAEPTVTAGPCITIENPKRFRLIPGNFFPSASPPWMSSPANPLVPFNPTNPMTPGSGGGSTSGMGNTEPSNPTSPQTQAGSAAGAAAAGAGASTVGGGGGEGGSGSLMSGAPNMFGDAFGGRGTLLTIPTQFRFLEQRSYLLGNPNEQGNAKLFFVSGSPLQISPVNGNEVLIGGLPLKLSNMLLFVQTPPDSVRRGTYAIQQSPEITKFITANFVGAGQIARFNSSTNLTFIEAQSRLGLGQVTEIYDFFNRIPGSTLFLPSPSGGGVVGRTKIADDNSPLPRDRFIFNYDYFNNASLGSGIDVSRISLGVEKTFLDQQASVELRIPFASTLDSTSTADGMTGRATEFGNIHVTLKALLYSTRNVFLTAGLGFSLPTAADTRVRLSDGTDMVRIRNQSLLVTPYFSALYAPDDRLFAQLWMAWNFDTNGNATDVNFDFGGLRQVGRVNDQTLAQIDTQLGYWVYRAADPSARLQGIAPFVELHYNGTVGRADVLSAGGFQIGTQGSLNELNLTLGATAQIGTNFLLSTGLVVPLRDNFDRSFDYQLGVRGTLFFGPTARSREAASRVSSF